MTPDLLLTVVVPTFDRGAELATTVATLYASEVSTPGAIELVVVDDGSARPVEPVVRRLAPPTRFATRVVHQENQGVGAARNHGFRQARGAVVLFVDDDMVLLPDTLQGHLDAHSLAPGAVVFGRSPYVTQEAPTPFTAWVAGLPNDPYLGAGGLVPVEVVASGHLSVERATVAGWERFYSDDMRTPVAEEYELSHRLASRGIPVFLAPDVVALHNRQVSLATFLRQQYGHGKGCGEASRRAPESLAVGELRAVVERHTRTGPGALPWSLLRTAAGCRLLSRLAGAADRGWVPRRARSVAFTAAAGASFSAGVRDGLRDRPGHPRAGSRAPARRRLRSGARFARG